MRAALYVRTACLIQGLESAVEVQLEALRNYATQNGMEIVDEFTDVGYSGLQRDRPGLNRMCDAAGRRGFDRVVDAGFSASGTEFCVASFSVGGLRTVGSRNHLPGGSALPKIGCWGLGP